MLGLSADFSAISLGCFLGDLVFSKRKISSAFSAMCGIIIAMMSAVGFFSKTLYIKNGALDSPNLLAVIICLLVGYLIGEGFDLESKISNTEFLKNKDKKDSRFNTVLTGTLLFAVGGMAIIGPIDVFVNHDNTTLYIKSLIDFTLALSIGSSLGKWGALSAVPVTFIQIAIGCISRVFSNFFDNNTINLLCSVGYVILFFSGVNFLSEKTVKIKTADMMPSILLVLIYRAGNLFINYVR